MSGVDVISTGISFASGIVASIYERFVSRPYTSVMNGVLRDYRLVDIVTSFAAMLVVVGMVYGCDDV